MMSVQDINFTGNDEENIKDVFSSHVNIYPSAKSALDHGDVSASSKISIQPAVKYFWDYQYYVTRLISRHYASSLIAYAIKHVKKTDSDEDVHLGMVRLLNTVTGKKLLLRSFSDRITYIDFALRSEAFLAILDHSGTIGVFKIDQGLSSDDPMVSSLLFSLRPPEDFVALEICSLAWCPWVRGSKSALLSANDNNNSMFVPPRDPSLLLAYSAQHKVKVINVGLVVELLQNHFSQDSESEVSRSWSEKQLTDAIEGWATESLCYAELSDHSDAVTVIALSRDASCLASASLDGKVYLYSLVNRTFGGTMNKLKQIHAFSPHNGLPLYSLIFLDNVLHNDESITWNHLLTGAQHNREIRLWSCSDWSCLQVMQFCSVPTPSVDLLKPVNNSLSKPSLILSVDHSASFLIATDVTRRVLYTFELAVVNDPIISNDEVLSSSPSSSPILSVSKKMCFISIGEFLLTTPCLLFALGPFSRKAKNNIGSLSVKGKNDLHNVLTDQICLDIHMIHNRNLLNGTIRFDLPHRSELYKLKLITTILQQSSIEASNHPTTINNSSNNDDPIKAVPSSSSSLNSIIDQQVEFSEVLDEDNSAETLSMKQAESNTLKDQPMVLDAEMRNVSNSDCLSSINNTKKYDSNNNNDTVIISPIKYEPPEADKLQDVLSITFLNMNNQLPEKGGCIPSLCQILLNTSGPAHNNHSSNDEIDTTNYIDENDINVSSITTTPVTPPLIRLPPPPQLFFTKPTITEEDSLKPTSIIPDNTPTIPKEANLQETSLNIISSALTTDKYVVDDKDTGIEMDTVVNPTAEEEEDIHDGDINNDNDDNCHNYQSFEDLKFVLKEDSEQNSAMPNSNDDNVCGNHYDHSIYNNTNYNNSSTPTNSNEMNMILNHLEMLSLSSREQSRQFECILVHHNKYQSSGIPSSPRNSLLLRICGEFFLPLNILIWPRYYSPCQVSSTHYISVAVVRTVQGDFSRRYAQISDNMKKILSNVQESSCHPSNKANALHNLESRISLLPKLTTDSIKLILHEELLRIFSSNVPRIVEPLQHSLCSVINSHLSTLPTTVNDNVQRVLREKNFTSQIVRSASGILSTELSGAYRDSLNKIFIPALEKSVKKLFSDLNNVFQTGTQQYLNQIPSRIQIPFDSANFTTSLMHDISSLIKSTILETLKEVEIPGKTIETSISNSGSERINPAKVNRTLDLYPTTSRRNDNSSEVVCDKMSNTTSNLTKLDKTATAHKSYNRHLNKTGSGGSVISTTPLVSNSGSSTSSHSVSNSSHQKNKSTDN
ncbi:Enhancer of mRNA-decapping protein [Schistosoma japonicum]|uniref:Enhancer of mRNA-decapping protein n=1 Tax=Schistosoma japonicum TaxID=6182 RepID=A0A4Z2DTX4_SCHJA|nr:Enhancer of mRNA-decapping protein [Schistosoma japonicum]